MDASLASPESFAALQMSLHNPLFKAVIWADVIQLFVYLAGGIAALWVASSLAGGFGETLTRFELRDLVEFLGTLK